MYTKAKTHNMGANFSCVLCGTDHQQNHACVELIDPDTSGVIGDICPDCIEAGPEGAAARTREYAYKLVRKAEAQWLELAAAVGHIKFKDWATLDDLQAAEHEAHRRFAAATRPAA